MKDAPELRLGRGEAGALHGVRHPHGGVRGVRGRRGPEQARSRRGLRVPRVRQGVRHVRVITRHLPFSRPDSFPHPSILLSKKAQSRQGSRGIRAASTAFVVFAVGLRLVSL